MKRGGGGRGLGAPLMVLGWGARRMGFQVRELAEGSAATVAASRTVGW